MPEKCQNFSLLMLRANPSPCLFVLLSSTLGYICCIFVKHVKCPWLEMRGTTRRLNGLWAGIRSWDSGDQPCQAYCHRWSKLHHIAAFLTNSTQLILVWCTVDKIWNKQKTCAKLMISYHTKVEDNSDLIVSWMVNSRGSRDNWWRQFMPWMLTQI